MATYQETIEYLYTRLPSFQKIGGKAIKWGLQNILKLCETLDYPHLQFPSLHIAGTNGKGSTSHSLAAILQEAGYKTGLYTSPHLKSFTERIRINGEEISPKAVCDFVEKIRPLIEEIEPSFFEITVAMAMDYFAQQKIDIAVIEVGMGGRLDSTNLITPLVSVITNISYDHQQFLGDTLDKIAFEKAGIIKAQIPVVISEHQRETDAVFVQKATECKSPLYFAQETYQVEILNRYPPIWNIYQNNQLFLARLKPSLWGSYQEKNIVGVLKTIEILQTIGWNIHQNHIEKGISQVSQLTGLKGRWQILRSEPLVICDTAHNEAGIREVVKQILHTPHQNLHLILGLTKDKDIKKILSIYPSNAFYYFCRYNAPRSLAVEELAEEAQKIGLKGNSFASVNEALAAALNNSQKEDLILIGGSTFVVAEVEIL